MYLLSIWWSKLLSLLTLSKLYILLISVAWNRIISKPCFIVQGKTKLKHLIWFDYLLSNHFTLRYIFKWETTRSITCSWKRAKTWQNNLTKCTEYRYTPDANVPPIFKFNPDSSLILMLQHIFGSNLDYLYINVYIFIYITLPFCSVFVHNKSVQDL